MASRDHEARGESPREAAYAARREFGNATLVREATRKMWRGAWLDGLAQDLKLALRSLRRTPAFTLTVVAMLGLGLGAAAAMYGILDRLLLRAPEGVRDPDGLFAPYLTYVDFRGIAGVRGDMQWREYRALANGMSDAAVSCAYMGPDRTRLTVGDVAVQAQVLLASVGYFGVLGPRPLLGRFFLPDDSSAAAPQVAVIGYAFWQREFGGDHRVLGRTVRQGRVVYAIVGVAPRGFSGATPDRVDVWLPAERAAPASFGSEWQVNSFSWHMIARARAGHTAAHAAALGFLRLRGEPADPRYRSGDYKTVQPGSIVPGRARVGTTSGLRLSFVVGGATALLAFIALANAAGLLLLRALRRRRETAVRLALGVSRGRLARAVAAESIVLGLLAGVAACFVASGGGELVRRLLLRVDWGVPVVDVRVGLLTVGASLGIGLLASLIPGWLAGRPETFVALKTGGGDSPSRAPRARAGLLVAQAALSVALLAGLSVYARSFLRARAFAFGPDVDHVLVAELQERAPVYVGPVAPEIGQEVASRVAGLPGVESVALSSSLPLWSSVGYPIRADGVDSFPRSLMLYGPWAVEATSTYFAATGLTVVRGRYFLDQGPGGPRESVVSEAMARVMSPAGDVIGRCLYVGRGATDCRRVVGVVRDVRSSLRMPGPTLNYYVPLSQAVSPIGPAGLIVRAKSPAKLVPAVRQIVAQVAGVRDPDLVRTLRDVVDTQYRPLRQGMALFGMLAGLAVVVAMIGMYGVVAYTVAQRAHEFAIRVALGAHGLDLAGLVARQGLQYAVAGLVLGLGLALLGGHYLAKLLYQTSPRDPLALCAAALALVVAALVACVIPAHAAARADPRQALQAE